MYFLAFFSLLSAATYLGCEKSGIPPTEEVLLDLPVTPVPASGALTDRADECEDCPVDDCCCVVEILSTSSDPFTDINLCGTSDGTDACGPATPGSPCFSNVSGGGQTFNLHVTNNPREVFCMNKNATFWLANTGNGIVDLEVTCQHNLTSPITYQFTITPSDRIYINNDGDCEVEKCL